MSEDQIQTLKNELSSLQRNVSFWNTAARYEKFEGDDSDETIVKYVAGEQAAREKYNERAAVLVQLLNNGEPVEPMLAEYKRLLKESKDEAHKYAKEKNLYYFIYLVV